MWRGQPRGSATLPTSTMNKKDKTKVESNVKADVLMRANHIYDDFKFFANGVRVLFLIHRNKEGGETNNTKVRKVITRNKEEFRLELIKLVDEKERAAMLREPLPYRIYSCVNARDIEKAIRQFKFEQLEADYYDDELRHGFYYDSKNRFVGALMTPSSRMKDQSYFVIDVDNEEGRDVMGEALGGIAQAGAKIIMQYATKNGWHIVSEPFNPNLFNVPGVEIKKDGLLLLSY